MKVGERSGGPVSTHRRHGFSTREKQRKIHSCKHPQHTVSLHRISERFERFERPDANASIVRTDVHAGQNYQLPVDIADRTRDSKAAAAPPNNNATQQRQGTGDRTERAT